MDIVIRNENKSDIKATSEITKAAFDTLPISNHTEQFIIDALRDANVLTISLVAVAGKKVVGHIAFSPVTVSDGSPAVGMVWVPSLSCRNYRSRVSENP